MRSIQVRGEWQTPCAVVIGLLALAWPAGTMDGAAVRQEVTVEAVRRLSPSPQPFPLVESWLAINPRDPANLLVSAMSVSAGESVVYGSWDGGRTWSVTTGPGARGFPDGDPIVTFDPAGRAYVGTLAGIWRSTDGGRTWGARVPWGSGRGYDRDWLTTGPPLETGGPPAVYGAVRRRPEAGEGERDVVDVAVSRDGGSTFTHDSVGVNRGYINSIMPLVAGPDGTVFLAMLVNEARMAGAPERYRGRRVVLTSRDGARTWSGPHAVADNVQFGNSVGDQAMKGLGIGSLTVDRSGGPLDGTLYMAWDSVLDDRVQVLFSRSADDGFTWSEPTRVNDGGFRSNHSLATVAVNRHGLVAVMWNDRRGDPSDRCFQPYVALSTNGGRTFGPNRSVSKDPTCPAGGRWLNGGDTNGLAALPDGSFRATWTAGQGRDLSIWTAVLRQAGTSSGSAGGI